MQRHAGALSNSKANEKSVRFEVSRLQKADIFLQLIKPRSHLGDCEVCSSTKTPSMALTARRYNGLLP